VAKNIEKYSHQDTIHRSGHKARRKACKENIPILCALCVKKKVFQIIETLFKK
jgi:hypothetical protein